MEKAGYLVEEVKDTPSFREATDLQGKLWLGDDFANFDALVQREGDPAAMMIADSVREMAQALPADVIAKILTRRATLTRAFQMFLEEYPLLLCPVSGRLPFADDEDIQSPASMHQVWLDQLTQTGLPLMALPGLVVSTGMVGTAPVGVQLISQRYREDLLLDAGAAIEAGGVPVSPIDPIWS